VVVGVEQRPWAVGAKTLGHGHGVAVLDASTVCPKCVPGSHCGEPQRTQKAHKVGAEVGRPDSAHSWFSVPCSVFSAPS